jgi:hypothetical protein
VIKRLPADTIARMSVGKISKAWLAAGAVLILAAGACVAWLRPGRPTEDELAVAVRDDLDARVVRALEGFEDPYALPSTGRLICAVHTLGSEPAVVSAVAQVRTAYVWALCTTPHREGEPGTGFSMPLAVRLADPVKVDQPGNGSSWEPDVRRIFPSRLHDLIITGAFGDELEPALQQRVRRLS